MKQNNINRLVNGSILALGLACTVGSVGSSITANKGIRANLADFKAAVETLEGHGSVNLDRAKQLRDLALIEGATMLGSLVLTAGGLSLRRKTQ